MRRLRRRLDTMQRQASGTMGNANALIDMGKDLIEDIQDGVSIKIVRKGEHSIVDFLLGKCDELPLSIKIDLEDDV